MNCLSTIFERSEKELLIYSKNVILFYADNTVISAIYYFSHSADDSQFA